MRKTTCTASIFAAIVSALVGSCVIQVPFFGVYVPVVVAILIVAAALIIVSVVAVGVWSMSADICARLRGV